MKNVTTHYNSVYLPWKAIIFHQSVNDASEIYREVFDFDRAGKPINAHPLTNDEIAELARALASSEEINQGYLQCKGLVPENLLHVNSAAGFAIWHTPLQNVHLHFVDKLKIPDGKCNIPALVWKADRTSLSVFAIKDKERPSLKSKLYHAPFFNMYKSGKVCMGNVNTDIEEQCQLENFITFWQQCFFRSRFSHVISGHIPTSTNIVQLWQSLSGRTKRFPQIALKDTQRTLRDLIQKLN